MDGMEGRSTSLSGERKRQMLQRENNEISLVDILAILWKRRLILIISTIITTTLTSFYIFSSSNNYIAQIVVSPSSDISPSLGIGITNEDFEVTPMSCLELFEKNAKDLNVQRQFGKDNKLFKRMEFLEFSTNLSVKKNSSQALVVMSLVGNETGLLSKILKDYFLYVNNLVRLNIINKLEMRRDEIKKTIENQVRLLRIQENNSLERQIAIILEQKQIAEKLNLVNISERLQGDSVPYLRGTRALQAEIDVLRARKNKDIFIEGIKTLQERAKELENIEFQKALTDVVKNQSISTEIQKTKSKLLPLSLGIMLGLLLGSLIVFVFDFVTRLRLRKENG